MTPTEVVVDASVFVAAVLADEPSHGAAFAFLQTCARLEIARLAPAIIAAEVKGPVARRTGQPALARQLFAALRSRPDFVVLPIDAIVGDEAGELASLQGIKGCDAVYVAVARLLTIPLVTLYREQQERAPADVEVYTPEQALAKWWPS
jgi:predicted nucleic acid-binding protein